MRVKEKSERARLKLNIKKSKIMPSGPITSRQIEGDKVEVVTYFLFLDTKITADSDCSHEIRRCLLLGRKAMTNLESVLKSRDITLLTKVHIVKAMVFPAVMYGCESWTLKKANSKELTHSNCGAGAWTARRSNQSILREINPENSLEGLMLKLQYFHYLMQTADSLKKPLRLGRIESRRRGNQRMTWLDGVTDEIDMNLGKLWDTVWDREARHAAIHGGHKELDTTGQLNNNIVEDGVK